MAEKDKFEAMEVKTKKQLAMLEKRKKAKRRNYIVGLSLCGVGAICLGLVYYFAATVWLVDLTTLPYIEYTYSTKKGETEATILRLKSETNYPAHFRIPDKVNGLTVTAIAPSAFAGCQRIESIDMPDTITTIGAKAFKGLKNLKDIYFSANLENLGTEVLDGTPYLANIPDDELKIISKILFKVGKDQIPENCVLLASHDSVVPEEFNQPQYNKVYISDWDERIASWSEGLFNDYDNIVYAEIPSYLDVVPTNTFRGCDNLREVTFSGETQIIDSFAFIDTPKLEKVNINDKIKHIGESAFENSGIKDIDIPETVLTLGKAAFKNCDKITTFDWPEHFEEIPENIFEGCSSLQTLNFTPKSIEKITSIGSAAFKGTKLSKFTMPKQVGSVNNSLFEDVSTLTSVRLYQGHSYMDGENKLQNVGVVKIGQNAFANTALKEVILYDKDGKDITPKNEINFPKILKDFYSTGSIGKTFAGTAIESFTFTPNMSQSSYQMFKDCQNLKEVKFETAHDGPKRMGVKFLEMETFDGCNAIEHLELADSIEDIGAQALGNMKGLKTVKLPVNEKFSALNEKLFINDDKLETIEISELTYYAKRSSFENTYALKYVYFPLTEGSKFQADRGAFYNCRPGVERDPNSNLVIGQPLPDEEKLPIFLNFPKKDLNTKTSCFPPEYDEKGNLRKRGWYDEATCHVYFAGEWQMVDGVPTPIAAGGQK